MSAQYKNYSAPNIPAQSKYTVSLFGEVLADVFPDKTVLGGAPYNVARHLRGFNQQPVMITRTGHDALRNEFLAELTRLDIDNTGFQLDPTHPTGQVTVRIENNEPHFDIQTDQAYDYIHAGLAHLTTLKFQPDLAYFGTLAQRNMNSRLALDRFLNDTKCPRFLDVNLRSPFYTRHVIRRSFLRTNIVKLNIDELFTIADIFESKYKASKDHALFLMEKFNLKQMLVTCGQDGAWALSENEEIIKVEGDDLKSELVDTVGAGDAFSAVCILGLLRGWSTESMLLRAKDFASAICKIRGAAPESPDFYLPYISNWTD